MFHLAGLPRGALAKRGVAHTDNEKGVLFSVLLTCGLLKFYQDFYVKSRFSQFSLCLCGESL
jgi:hypothetical protein